MPAPVYPSPVYSVDGIAIVISPTVDQTAAAPTTLASGVMPSWQTLNATTGVIA